MITTTRTEEAQAPKDTEIHYGLLDGASKPKPLAQAAKDRYLAMGMTEEEAKQLLKA